MQNVSIYGLKSDGGLGKPLILSDFNKQKVRRPADATAGSLFSAFLPITTTTAPSYGVSILLRDLQRSDTDWYVTCADHLEVVGGEKHLCDFCTVTRARPFCDNETLDQSLTQACGQDYIPVEVLSAEHHKNGDSLLVKFAVDEIPTSQANVLVTVKPVKCTGKSDSSYKVRKADTIYPGSFVTVNVTDLPDKKFTAKYRVYLDIPVRAKQANFLLTTNQIKFTSAATAPSCGDDQDEEKKEEVDKANETEKGFESALQGIGNLFNNFGTKITGGESNGPKA